MYKRVLKVSSLSTHTDSRGHYVDVPAIRIQGRWVEKLGFETGKKVMVYEKPEEITLKLLKEDGSL